ncbi:hypothetical protein [Demequina zhanjiangensis]|uniref:Uncharacterized protein n=1 Tax=Demequina zhanjiangensis TaxID=3051659 RepID=A0ABT8FYJ7_9MICO|nr:hypothetical protein [Demequina sp. SYSU T00b26]MDN4471897.1 hypothetical protein [Demequina sp. SYSU T00b26]
MNGIHDDDLGRLLRARSEQLASREPAPDERAVDAMVARSRSARTRARTMRVGAVAASVAVVGAAAAGVVLWGGGASEVPPATPTPSPTEVSASPSSSAPAPTFEATLLDGFLPVPHLPAEAVPWDELGAGWFVVAGASPGPAGGYDESGELDFDWHDAIEPDVGISLLSPAGEWYAVRGFEGTGAGEVAAWDGSDLWLETAAVSGPDMDGVRLMAIDARTGEATAPTRELVAGQLVPLRTGSMMSITSAFGYGRADVLYGYLTGMDLIDADGSQSTLCPQEGWDGYGLGTMWQDLSYFVGPGADAPVLCFLERSGDSAGTTAVFVAHAATGEMTQIATFSNPADRYAFAGWRDASTAYVARLAPGSEPAGVAAMFLVDISDGSATEVSLPMYDGLFAEPRFEARVVQAFYDRVSERHVRLEAQGRDEWISAYLSGDESGGIETAWEVEVFDAPGAGLGSVTWSCPSGFPEGVDSSGGLLALRCGLPTGEVTAIGLVDLADASLVGEWQFDDLLLTVSAPPAD